MSDAVPVILADGFVLIFSLARISERHGTSAGVRPGGTKEVLLASVHHRQPRMRARVALLYSYGGFARIRPKTRNTGQYFILRCAGCGLNCDTGF